jgi:ectoine hydroxylase-related dioxygenase (phytanoyl-CoA dioxygenase family)
MALRRMIADRPLKVSRLPSFRAEHFPDSGPYPWLDQPDALERVDRKISADALTPEEARQCRYWRENGYIVLERLIEGQVLDDVWDAYENAVRAGKIQLPPDPVGDSDPHPGRYLNPHKKAARFCRILKHPGLLHWLRVLLEREPKTLQTIASHKGSQQGIHSDSIHMTTYPLGYLAAAWIAFEDIHPDCGPLVYYPGSHRLPLVFSKDVGISEADFQREGYGPYHAKYEPRIREVIAEHKLQPQYFHARKGDVLIWHANLLHGGSMRRDLQLSRKAVVCHFFGKGAFVYHDLSAARSRQQYMGTCMLRDDSGGFRGVGRAGRTRE